MLKRVSEYSQEYLGFLIDSQITVMVDMELKGYEGILNWNTTGFGRRKEKLQKVQIRAMRSARTEILWWIRYCNIKGDWLLSNIWHYFVIWLGYWNKFIFLKTKPNNHTVYRKQKTINSPHVFPGSQFLLLWWTLGWICYLCIGTRMLFSPPQNLQGPGVWSDSRSPHQS